MVVLLALRTVSVQKERSLSLKACLHFLSASDCQPMSYVSNIPGLLQPLCKLVWNLATFSPFSSSCWTRIPIYWWSTLISSHAFCVLGWRETVACGAKQVWKGAGPACSPRVMWHAEIRGIILLEVYNWFSYEHAFNVKPDREFSEYTLFMALSGYSNILPVRPSWYLLIESVCQCIKISGCRLERWLSD